MSKGGDQQESGGGEEAENSADRGDRGEDDQGSDPQASGDEAEASDEGDEQDEDSDEDDQSAGDAEASEEQDDEEEGREEGDESRPEAEMSDESEDDSDDRGEDDDQGEGGGRVSAITRYGRRGLERGKEMIAPQWEAHPLMICAAALAVGAAVGLLLPSTDLEDGLMGGAADKVNARLKKGTGGVVGQGKRAATAAIKEATSAVAREAEREGLTPDRLGRKVSRMVSHVRQAVSDAVDEA
jgi:hypothetical protein